MPTLRGGVGGSGSAGSGDYYTSAKASAMPTYHAPTQRISGQSKYASPEAEAIARPYADVGKVNISLFPNHSTTPVGQQVPAGAQMPSALDVFKTMQTPWMHDDKKGDSLAGVPLVPQIATGIDFLANLMGGPEKAGNLSGAFYDRLKNTPDDQLDETQRQIKSLNRGLFTDTPDSPIMQGRQINEMWKAYQIADAHRKGESGYLNPQPADVQIDPISTLMRGYGDLTNLFKRAWGAGPVDIGSMPIPMLNPLGFAIGDQFDVIMREPEEKIGPERQAIKEQFQAGEINENEARDLIALSSFALSNPNMIDLPDKVGPVPILPVDTILNFILSIGAEFVSDPLSLPAIAASGGSYAAKTPITATLRSVERTVARSIVEQQAKLAGKTAVELGEEAYKTALSRVTAETQDLAAQTMGQTSRYRYLPKASTAAAKQTGRVEAEAVTDMDRLTALMDMGADTSHEWSDAIRAGIDAAGTQGKIAVRAPTVIKLGQAIDKLVDPFSMFGYWKTGRVVPLTGSKMAAHGFTDAIGWRVTRAIDNAFSRAGVAPDGVQKARSIAAANHAIQAGDNANTQRMVASNSAFIGPETPTEAAKRHMSRRDGDIRKLVRDQVDRTLEFILPRHKGGAAEETQSWRDRAARQLQDFGATEDDARAVAAGMDERQMRGLANDHWGLRIDRFDEAKRNSQPTTKWDREGIDRMTFMGPRQMASQDADTVIKAIAEGKVDVVRAAVRKFRDLNQFISEDLDDAELLKQVAHVLNQIKNALPTAIEDLSDLPPEMAAFLRDFPDDKLMLRPGDDDLLVPVKDASGKVIGAKSWIDFVTDRTPRQEITKFKAWREELLRGIAGGELERNVGRRFAFVMAEQEGITEAESASILRSIREAAEIMGGGPRALSADARMKAVDNAVGLSPTRKVLAKRAVADALFEAYENEMRLVGVVPKATGWVKKQTMPIGGGVLAWATDYLYPVVRFTKNGLFFLQEVPEAPFFLALQGRYPMSSVVPGRLAETLERVPGVVGDVGRTIRESKEATRLWNDKTIVVMDRMTRTSPNAEYDMYEASQLVEMGLTVASQMTDPRTRLGKLLKGWQTLPQRKRQSVALAIRKEFGEQWKRSLLKNTPEQWRAVRAFFPDSMDDDEVAVQWVLDLMSRSDPDSVYSMLSPNLFQPNHIGRRAEVSDKLVRHFVYGEAEAGNHTWAHMVQEVRDGTLSIDQIRADLHAAGADADYVERTVRKIEFGTADEFYQAFIDLGLDPDTVAAWRLTNKAKGERMGVADEAEYLARKFVGKPLHIDQMGNMVGDTLYDDVVVSMRLRGKPIPGSDHPDTYALMERAHDMITEVLRPEPVPMTRAEVAGRISVPTNDWEIKGWAQTPGNETTKLRLLWSQTEQLMRGLSGRKKSDPLYKVAERRYKVVSEAIKEIEDRHGAWPNASEVDEDGVLHLDSDGDWGEPELGPGEVDPNALGPSMLHGLEDGSWGVTEEEQLYGDGTPLDPADMNERTFVYRNENGKPVAAVYVFLDVNGKPRDLSTYVSPGYRRQGIATQIYDAIQMNTDINLEPISGVTTTPRGDAFTRTYWNEPSPGGEVRFEPIPPKMPKGTSEDARKAANKVRGWETVRRSREADPKLHRQPMKVTEAVPPTPAAFTASGPWRELPPELVAAAEPSKDFVYHTTPAANMDGIREGGLIPSSASREDEPPAIYFAGSGRELAGLVPRASSDINTLLRVNVSRPDVPPLERVDIHATNGPAVEYVSREPITPDQIEVYGQDGQWHSVTGKDQTPPPPAPFRFDPDTGNAALPEGFVAEPSKGHPVAGYSIEYADDPLQYPYIQPGETGYQATARASEIGVTDMRGVIVRDGEGKPVGFVYATLDPETNTLHVSQSQVLDPHGRKGLGNWMYRQLEEQTGATLMPVSDQSESARALWAQPDRPFGPQRRSMREYQTGLDVGTVRPVRPLRAVDPSELPTFNDIPEEYWPSDIEYYTDPTLAKMQPVQMTPDGRLIGMDNRARVQAARQQGLQVNVQVVDFPPGKGPGKVGFVYRTVRRNRWRADWDPGTYVSHDPGARYAEDWDAVMLRTSEDVTGWDQATSGVDPDSNRTSRGSVFAEDIEYYGADGKWHPVLEPQAEQPLYQSGIHTIGVTTPRQYRRQIEQMMDPVAAKRHGMARAMTEKEALTAIQWYDHIRRAQFALVDDSLTGDERIMAAARLLIEFGTTQLNTSPADGFRHVFKAHGMKARGEELQLGEARNIVQQMVGLNPEQLHALVWNDASKISQMGIAQKLFDFIDSLTGAKRRTNGILGPKGDWGPVAVDVHTKRDFGYLDKAQGGWAYKLISIKKGNTVVNGVSSKFVEGQGFVIRMSDGTTEIIPEEHIGKGIPTDGEYDVGVELGNDIRDYFNEIKFMGREWSSYEVQALGWYRMQLLKSSEGDAGEVANAIFEQGRWMGSNDVFPGEGAPLAERHPWLDVLPDHAHTIMWNAAHHASDEAEMASGARVITKRGSNAIHDGESRPALVVELATDLTGATDYTAQYGMNSEQDVVVLMRDVVGGSKPPKYHGAGSGTGVGISVDIPVRSEVHGEELMARLAVGDGAPLRAIGPRTFVAQASDGSWHLRTLWEPTGPTSDRRAFQAALDGSGLEAKLADEAPIHTRSVEYTRTENDWLAQPDGKGHMDVIERGAHRHPVNRTPEQRVALVERYDAAYATAIEATAKARRMKKGPKRDAAIEAAEKAEAEAKKEMEVARAIPSGRSAATVHELVRQSRLRVRQGVEEDFDRFASREVRHGRERILGEARDAAGDDLGTDPTWDDVLDLPGNRASNGERLFERTPGGRVRAAITRSDSDHRRSQLYFNRGSTSDASLVHEIFHQDAWEMDDSANRVFAGQHAGLEGTPFGQWVPGTPLTEPQHEWLVSQYFLWAENEGQVHPTMAPLLKHLHGKLGSARTLKSQAVGPSREAIKRIDAQISILNARRGTLRSPAAIRRVDASIASLRAQRAASQAEAAAISAQGGLSPAVKQVLDDLAAKAGARSETRASTFNADEQNMLEWAQIAMAASQKRANDLVHMRGERSALERSINHPFLAMYPTSYMYGKVLPYLTEFLMARPFGMKAPFLAYTMGNSMHASFQRQQQYDEDLRLFLYKNEPFLRAMSLFVPGLPWDLPSGAPFWMRRIIENWLTNNVRRMNGEKEEDIDIPGMIADSALYNLTLRGTEAWQPIIQGAQQAPDIFSTMATGKVPPPKPVEQQPPQ